MTTLEFKQDNDDWEESNLIKGALAAGVREFQAVFNGAVTLKYKIGVTINGNPHTNETEEFNVTE